MFNFIGNTIESVLWLCCAVPIIGFLAGGIARYIMRSGDYSFLSDMVIGIAGSVIGNIVLSFFIDPDDIGGGRIISSLVVSIFGAIILIFVGRRLFGNEAKRNRRKRR